MHDDEVIARADANYFAAMASFIGSAPGAEIRAKDGIVLTSSATQVAAFNVAFVTRALDEPRRQVRDAVAFFEERDAPFILRVREGVDPRTERTAEELGLRYTDTVPGMVLFPPRLLDDSLQELDIRLVNDDDQGLADHADVIAAAFEMPLELARAFITRRLFAQPDAHGYVGYVGGAPVATSALFMTHRVAGIYNVATLREHRGRGIGEAMTGHAMREGVAAGAVMASLQASEMGQPVYERMGFRTIAPYRTYGRAL